MIYIRTHVSIWEILVNNKLKQVLTILSIFLSILIVEYILLSKFMMSILFALVVATFLVALGLITIMIVNSIILDNKGEKSMDYENVIIPDTPEGKSSDNNNQKEFIAQVITNSNIFKVPSYFIGIPFFIVFGGMESKYESIFLVEHEGEYITIVYPGICSVSKNDEVKISGLLVSGKKAKVVGKCIRASFVEIIN